MSLYLGNTPIANSAVSRNIGEIVQSTIPLTDAGLHLLDGSVIQRGSYADFVDYIAGLVSTYPDLFTTEANWQQSVSTYGACDKYVYDSVNNTVRIPKRSTEHGKLIKAYFSGSNWYRIYEDGWCEQGGHYDKGSLAIDTSTTIQLLKAYPNINYTLVAQSSRNDNQAGSINNQVFIIYRATTEFTARCYGDGTSQYIDWYACGYVDVSDYQYSPIYEYIVIANSTKTNIEVDIDEIATDLNGKVDKADLSPVHVVIDTYENGTSWYRVYDDGWVEQGGAWGGNTSSWAEASVTFLKPFSNTNYQLFVQGNWSDPVSSSCKVTYRSTTGFTGTYANNLYSVMPSWWYARGQGV